MRFPTTIPPRGERFLEHPIVSGARPAGNERNRDFVGVENALGTSVPKSSSTDRFFARSRVYGGSGWYIDTIVVQLRF